MDRRKSKWQPDTVNAERPVTVTTSGHQGETVFEVNGPISASEMPHGIAMARRLHISTDADNPCPEWVRNLRDLTDLTIIYQGRRELHSLRVHAPSGLRTLTLRGAGIRGIELDLEDPLALQVLDLQRTYLASLPDNIHQLTSLTELALDYPIKAIPDHIENLTNVRALILSDSLITELPKTIVALVALEELDISRTKITELPSEIGSLSALRQIIAQDAPIANIAPEIGDLANLRYLDLSGCPVRRLPPRLGHLPDSIELQLSGTKLGEPLPALVSRGTAALLSYLRSLEAGSTEQYEAKLLLLGEGNVGKSSLVAALLGQPFQTGRPTTHGIELNNLDLPHPTIDRRLTLTTWDFGGQEVYRVTHQFFYSPRSLYLLVWHPREGQDENAVEAWIHRVRLRIGDTAKIIIVATYGAEGRNPELDFPYLKHKFGEILLASVTVDNETGIGIEELREAIAVHAATLPQMGELLSEAWIAARDEILAQSARYAYITWPELTEICGRQGLDEAETTTLVTLLHDLGHLIHFSEDDGLHDIVVLRPEWLTKAIGSVLEDKPTRAAGGVLSYRRLPDIWSPQLSPDHDSRNAYDAPKHPYFLRLMEKFDVSYRLPDQQATLIGQLVPYERPPLPWYPSSPVPRGIRTLVLLCRMSESPPGLIAWLTVRNHRFWTGLHWRRGVFLEHAEHHAQGLFELVTDGELRLTVRAPSPDVFFGLMCDAVDYLIKDRWQGLRYELLVPCPQRLRGMPCDGTFSHAGLRRFRELGKTHIDCHVCAQPQEVARLLTGFQLISAPFDERLRQIVRHLEDIKANEQRDAAIAAETAAQVRSAIKMLNTEVDDCPRLFIIDQVTTRRRLPWNDRFQLILCCEQPGHEHPWEPATYRFTRPKTWFREVLPYAIFAGKLLRIAMPIAGSAVQDLMPPQSSQWLKNQFDIVKSVAQQIPDSIAPKPGAERRDRQLTPAQGAGLRAYRHLLLELDPARVYGRLHRVMTTSGDLLWVCPDHYRDYEPGLPLLNVEPSR
ncbi:MAG TPA: COR domain-containing protein [Pseudonocardiaceae bacterium]|jgi:GTPase SAR1 family protein